MKDTSLTRRALVRSGAAALLTASLAPTVQAARSRFSFVHVTDTHIQPELDATEGVKKAFAAIRRLKEKPAFVLVGGDIVMDTAFVDRKRAELLYDLWQQAAAELRLPVYYSVGNHDVYAIGGDNKVAPSDPDFGKKWWMKRLGIGNRFQTFEHQGWKFIVLDSVQVDADKWWGELDTEQMNWIGDTLRKTEARQPIVFLTHIPLMTIYGLYSNGTTAAMTPSNVVKNGKEFKEMIQGKNVKAVLQGHTHVVETCEYLGVRYISGGAVCGEWWQGPRLGVHPEGFGVVTVDGENLTYRYQPYGWQARAAK